MDRGRMILIVPISGFRYRKGETVFNFDWAKRTHKGLRRWILYIVHDDPKTGAEIMDVMEGNLQGWWRPSPGSIYPLLKKMVEEGVLSRSADDRYGLTRAGMDEVNRPMPWFGNEAYSPRSAEGAVEVISSYTSYLEDLARLHDKKVAENAPAIQALGVRLSKIGGAA